MHSNSMKRVYPFVILLFFTLLFSSCSQSPANTPSAATTPTPADTTAIGSEGTADPSKGTVTGVLKLNGKPMEGILLGLGTVLQDQSGLEIATSYDPIESPQTSTLADGSFKFVNVPAGRYGLIYANLAETYLLLVPGDPNVTNAILVTVEAGQKADLGELDFDELPEKFSQ